jgi:hypothetical protein
VSGPRFAPVDDDTADLLAMVADAESPVGRDAVAAFLAACEADAANHGGIVSVSRVGAALTEAGIEHHRYSSFWSHFTGHGKPMRPATTADTDPPWEIRRGSKSGNNGKPMRLRVWVGGAS